jgi:hypothetical protein
MFATEQSFCSNLVNARDVLIAPLLAQLNDSTITVTDNSFLEIFVRLDQVIVKSREFLSALEKFGQHPADRPLFDVFANFGTLVPDFFTYIRAFFALSPALRKERAANPDLEQFCQSREAILKDGLQSFLIQPVQRPPRYQLFLNELLKSARAGSSEHEFLEETRTALRESIAATDRLLEESDDAAQRATLTNRFIGVDLTGDGRWLYFHSDVNCVFHDETKPLYVVVMSDGMTFGEDAPNRKLAVYRTTPAGEFSLSESLDDTLQGTLDFNSRERSFRLVFANPASKKSIFDAYAKMLEFNKLSAEALDQIEWAPVLVPGDRRPACMLCGTKFTLVIRRHHCVYCGGSMCGKCMPEKVSVGGEPRTVCTRCLARLSLRQLPPKQ